MQFGWGSENDGVADEPNAREKVGPESEKKAMKKQSVKTASKKKSKPVSASVKSAKTVTQPPTSRRKVAVKSKKKKAATKSGATRVAEAPVIDAVVAPVTESVAIPPSTPSSPDIIAPTAVQPNADSVATTRPQTSYHETMESIDLKWGARLPKVGFGFWKVEKDRTADICRSAIEVGYRHLDCACDYGNEAEVGQGIAQAIDDSLCEREDLWVTSKLWNTCHAAEHVRSACERSLQDLGLDYLDLYLIHFPIAQRFVPFEKRYPPGWFFDPNVPDPTIEEARVPISETWQAMEELAKSGLVRNIGICNFGTSQIRDLLTYAKIRPAVLQVETHPYLTQEKLLRYCHQEKIAYTAFSPLGAQSYFSLGMADPSEAVMGHAVVKEIAQATGKTAAQVLLRWGVQRGAAVIPKTSIPERMEENINIFDFTLTDVQMKAISALDQGRRFNDPGHFGEAAFNTFLPIYE